MPFTSYVCATYELENFITECLCLEHFEFAEMEAVLAAQEVAYQIEDEEEGKMESEGKPEEEEEGILNKEDNESSEETVEGLKREVALVKKQLGEARSEGAVAQLLQENVESMERRNRSLEEELATTLAWSPSMASDRSI